MNYKPLHTKEYYEKRKPKEMTNESWKSEFRDRIRITIRNDVSILNLRKEDIYKEGFWELDSNNNLECIGKLESFISSLLQKEKELSFKEGRAAMAEEVKVKVEENYHYWRECVNCGKCGNYYLHCLHDKIQTECIECGNKLPIEEGNCECEFVITEPEILSIINQLEKE